MSDPPSPSPFATGPPLPMPPGAPVPPGGDGRRRSRDRALWVLAGVVGALSVVVLVLGGLLLLRGGDDTPGENATATTGGRTDDGSTTSAPGAPSSTTGPPPTGGSVQGDVVVLDRAVRQGPIQREYLVLAPARPPDGRMPVVMVLHGLGVDRGSMASIADWREAVAADGFVAVFPQGIANSWNAGPCCPPATLLGTDDLAFLDTVLAEVRSRPDVDDDRTYVAGFSNGGMMTYSLACARSDEFAAVAPMAGSNVSGCRPTRPLSLLHVHGNPDPTVSYDGSPTPAQVLSSQPFPDVPSSVAAWAAADACGPTPEDRARPDGVTVRRWNGCAEGTEVELVTHPGNGHSWPTSPVDGIDVVLRFFGIRGG